jgi:hypothetical protein
MSVLVAWDAEPHPVPNVRIPPERLGSYRIHNTDYLFVKFIQFFLGKIASTEKLKNP